MAVADLRKRIVGGTSRIVTLDIERLPGLAVAQRGNLTISGPFWGLSDWQKGALGRRLRPEEVTRWPRTICAAWQVYGTDRLEFSAEWQTGGRTRMLNKLWAVLDNADALVGHNMASFDRKHVQGELLEAGFAPPKPFKVIDTLTEARRSFAFESNKLGALCDRLGVPTKEGHYDAAVAEAACTGSREAQADLREYNKADIVATEALYDRLRGWMPQHPHLKGVGEMRCCNQCGSTDLELLAETYQAIVLTYALYRCGNCGGHARAGHVARVATTRGV